MNHIDGWQAVRSVATQATLAKPEPSTSTKIRKELAATLQLLDMNEAELTWLTTIWATVSMSTSSGIDKRSRLWS